MKHVLILCGIYGGLLVSLVSIIIGIVVLFKDYTKWKQCTRSANKYVKLDRKTITNLYRVAPDRWKLEQRYGCTFLSYRLDDSYYRVYVYTNFWEYLWFMHQAKMYCKRKKKQKEQDFQNQIMKRIIYTGQKDIEEQRALAQQEIESALKVQKEVLGRLAPK